MEDFTKAMAVLQGYFNYQLPTPIYDLYWQRFKSEDGQLFNSAATRIIDTFKPTSATPFPVVATILEEMGVSGDGSIRRILLLLKHVIRTDGFYKSVSFNDEALHQTIRCFGGWMTICNWHDRDWQINETKFIDSYKSLKHVNCNFTSPSKDYLVGWTENENSLHGYDDYIPKVAIYDSSLYITTGIINRQLIDRKHFICDKNELKNTLSNGSELTIVANTINKIQGLIRDE
jgi:hypothetical protein